MSGLGTLPRRVANKKNWFAPLNRISAKAVNELHRLLDQPQGSARPLRLEFQGAPLLDSTRAMDRKGRVDHVTWRIEQRA